MASGTISIEGAAQILRPPRDGLPFIRLDEAGAATLDAGDLLIEQGAIAAFAADAGAAARIDAGDAAVVPGFVDCHTHLPFAGWRAEEYAIKVAGVDYAEIAARGGGIAASARALAASSDEQVLALACELAREMLEHGTTTFECKSGYGLSEQQELRLLALARRLDGLVAQSTTSTALLAHAVPAGRSKQEWMDAVAALVPEARDSSALDIFVESIAFDLDDLARVGQLASRSGKALRAHVEQFTTMHSVPGALQAGARSLEHLVRLDPAELQTLARAECAAVLLPAAELLGDEGTAPGRELADAGAIGVIATDANPGTAPVVSMPLVIALAVRRYRWSVTEALTAATLNAAWVLELSATLGSLEPGKRADVLVLDGPLEQLPYRLGHNPVAVTICGGEVVHVRPDQRWRLL
jgi:imidazolonepropionase